MKTLFRNLCSIGEKTLGTLVSLVFIPLMYYLLKKGKVSSRSDQAQLKR